MQHLGSHGCGLLGRLLIFAVRNAERPQPGKPAPALREEVRLARLAAQA